MKSVEKIPDKIWFISVTLELTDKSLLDMILILRIPLEIFLVPSISMQDLRFGLHNRRLSFLIVVPGHVFGRSWRRRSS